MSQSEPKKHLLRRLAALLLALALLCAPAALPARAEEAATPGMADAFDLDPALPTGDLWQMPEPEPRVMTAAEQATAESAQSAEVALYNASGAGVCYGYLTTAQQAIYNAFMLACEDVEDCGIVAVDPSLGGTKSDASLAINALVYDHPEIFWTGGQFHYYITSKDSGVINGVQMDEGSITVTTQAELAAQKQAMSDAADAILEGVDLTGSEALVALRVHDALIAALVYDKDGAEDKTAYLPHTAYNALVTGTAVCDGYSKAYIYLLGRCGITATMVTSTSINHGWNMVSLGGDWYESDLTWDDSKKTHAYYDLTTAAMATAHRGTRNTTGVTGLLPTAYGTTYTYEALTGIEDTTDYGTGVRGFVARLYQVCLDREPDTKGLTDWISRLKSGEATGTQVAYGFVFSNEFKAKNYCNEDYVKRLYQALMGRDYDDAGLADWQKRLKTGATREGVFNGFAQSDEFKALCAGYDIAVGEPVAIPTYGTVPTGPCSVCGEIDGVTAFVTRMYDVCLDRKPEAAGLADWTNRLWSHTASGRQVALGFIFSDEFKAKKYSNMDYVEHLYKAFLGRASDTAGKADWLARMANGWTREQVFDGFVGSDEFSGICSSYGIVRG